jgi:signal transduction histidine kinase/DNA-binding response OmpR family regulator
LYIFSADLPVNQFVPPVYITSLTVNGRDFSLIFPETQFVSDLKSIDLTYNQNNLKFEFAALNYTHPEKNKYRYYMEGMDMDTVEANPGSPAEYKQMSPGKYRFWVTGSNSDGLWNKSGISVAIKIHPPYYRSFAAYIFYFFVVAALIAGYIRFRIYSLNTEKLKLEREVKHRTAELEIKNRQLAEIDRIKTHFFTDISHEIRTPLSLIIGPLEALSNGKISHTRMTGLLELMNRNAQRLMKLVDQLLDISRLDARKMMINLSEDDIVKCLKILLYEYLSAAEGKQIRYIVDMPEFEFITWFDRDKIEKIVSNLLSNAFKYTPIYGTIQCTIKIDHEENNRNQALLKIFVTDSGPGISSENLKRIFDRFFRVEGRNESQSHGTGIGLSLTQELTSLLHGEINVSSTPGKGTEFFVSLPLGKTHLSKEEYIIINPVQAGRAEGTFTTHSIRSFSDINSKTPEVMMKVLIIEDNEDLRSFIRENLADQYQVLGAENGRTGINIAFTMMPDIIVTDIMMPDVTGIVLCAQLKNDERTSHIPIIMLTAKTTMDDKLEGLRSGADDYIIKPFIMDELKARIANLLTIRENLKLKYREFTTSEQGGKNTKSIDDIFLERTIRIINENISDFDFDVGKLHERMGMSRMHLSRKLRILTGLSPHILIRNIRMQKAAELLVKNAGNITEIAYSVGISNASGFTNAFRDYFGVSPKKYSK